MSFNSTQESYCLSAAFCDFGQETLMCGDEKIDEVMIQPELMGDFMAILTTASPKFVEALKDLFPGRRADFRCYNFMVIDELLSTLAAA